MKRLLHSIQSMEHNSVLGCGKVFFTVVECEQEIEEFGNKHSAIVQIPSGWAAWTPYKYTLD